LPVCRACPDDLDKKNPLNDDATGEGVGGLQGNITTVYIIVVLARLYQCRAILLEGAMPNSTANHQSAARRIAAKNTPVFPCGKNKKPYIKHGFHGASADPAQTDEWWARWPDAQIGVPTGAASRMIVLDLDRKNGQDGIRTFDALCAGLQAPDGPVVRTPSGGLHIYMLAPGERYIPCSVSRLGPGIDVRGDGGYVIVPPSLGYSFLQRAPLMLPPQWLLDLMTSPPVAKPEAKVRPLPRYAGGRFERRLPKLLLTVARAPEGRRNATLFWTACRLGEAVSAGKLSEASVLILAEEAGIMAGLPQNEARRTARSGVSKGMEAACA
jgi:hypothetical protein